ncbi:MAG: cysteine desulfurase [Acidobacteriia bacterium]|nr:cysteine desulfurase [Terriglobia bacterium]
MNRFYFDHNATTPVCPEAAQAWSCSLTDAWANPSSIHRDGQAARNALESARAQVAALLHCQPAQIVFTSGGTESDNLAILGAVRAHPGSRKHVVTSTIEHPAVLAACAQLEREGVAVTYVGVDASGLVNPDYVKRSLRPETVLISLMHANNETGVVQPVEQIAALAREAGVLMHSDGVQAAGRLQMPQVDLYSVSAHKMYAPKGCGALYVRSGIELQTMLYGGRHERSRRPGTENVAGAVAFGAAAGLAQDNDRLPALRDRLESAIIAQVPGTRINGSGAPRISNTTNISFQGVEGESLVIALDLRGFAVSTGAACSSGALEPSHVLLAMGLPREQAKASLRFSLGRGNDESQVDALISAVIASAAHLRRLSPTYAHV